MLTSRLSAFIADYRRRVGVRQHFLRLQKVLDGKKKVVTRSKQVRVRSDGLLSMPTRLIRTIETLPGHVRRCGIAVHGSIHGLRDFGSSMAIGFATRTAALGNDAVDRNRARYRTRDAAADALHRRGIPGLQYVFTLTPPVLFMSPIDIHNEINCAMNTLAKLGKANRDDRELMPGRKLLTIDAILNTLPAEFVAETQTMAGQYALGLFSGSIWDGSARTFYTYLSGLERLRQTDPVLDDILNCRKHFNGSFGNATYVCNVQRQSNLMRFFIRYTFPREHLKHLPEITRIFARLLDSPGAHIP